VAVVAALRHCARLQTLWLDGTRVRGELPDADEPGLRPASSSSSDDPSRPATASSRPSTAARQPTYVPSGGGWGALPALRSLTSLSLAGCRLISEGSLCALCGGAPNLTQLWLGGTPASGRTLEAISEALPALRSLSLLGCAELRHDELPLLLLGCPQLQALDLSRCSRVETINFHHSTHSLLELQLSRCPKLSRAAISAVAESCEALRSLALQACATLDDALLLEIGQGCSQLRRLHLEHCVMITERGAFYVATSCRELEELRLCGCESLEDEEALAAAHGCTQMRLLELPSGRVVAEHEPGVDEGITAR